MFRSSKPLKRFPFADETNGRGRSPGKPPGAARVVHTDERGEKPVLRGIYAAASGMLLEGLRTDVVANNLANAQTHGFKRQSSSVRAFPELLIHRINDPVRIGNSQVDLRPAVGFLGTGAAIDELALDATQGAFRFTGRELDLAIEGPGFFAVLAPGGQIAYTRDGSLNVDSEGYLVTAGGLRLLGEDGPIQVGSAANILIDPDGLVWIDGTARARVALWEFSEPRALERLGGNLLVPSEGSGPAVPATGSRVQREHLELANVNVVRELVDLIAIQRAYEASQRMIAAQDESLGRLINDVSAT